MFNKKQICKFVFVNYSNNLYLQSFHGKAVALDVRDHNAPFPSLFIIHEMRVRGCYPFEPVSPVISRDPSWQDWISSDRVLDDTSGSFIRGPPPGNSSNNNNGSVRTQLPTRLVRPVPPGVGSSVGLRLELNPGVIAEILSVTRTMPSWKACQMEGTD